MTALSSRYIQDFLDIRRDVFSGTIHFRVKLHKKGVFPRGKMFLKESQIDLNAQKRLYKKIKQRGKI